MHYRSYMLRLWQTDTNGKRGWRISLQDTESDQQENFTSMEELVIYLQNTIENFPGSVIEDGEEDAVSS